MGRAVVVESLGYGRYVVDISRDSAEVRAFARRQKGLAQTLSDSLSDLLTAANAAESTMASARQRYVVDQLAAEPGTVSEFLPEYLSAFAAYERARSAYLSSKARVAELESRAAAKLATLSARRAAAWCATYTRIPVGTEVGTIEVGRQGSQIPYTVIAPLGRDPVAEDGILRDVMSMTPAQAFLNYATLPGAIQWRRIYSRASVIETDLDSETLYVSIHTFLSAGIYIHRDPANLWLPYIRRCPLEGYCEYKVGDHVLIEHDAVTYEPKQVIGWSEWPRPCLGDHLKTLTLTEGLTTVYPGADSEAFWPDGYQPCGETNFVVTRIDAAEATVIQGRAWTKYPQPDDGKNYDYYKRLHFYGAAGAFPWSATQEQHDAWIAALGTGPHMLAAGFQGEEIRYSYAPWGPNDKTVVATSELITSQPTDFTTIERFFGDGEVRSLRAEFHGCDQLSWIRGECSDEEVVDSVDISNDMVVLTSEYAVEKMCAFIDVHEMANGTYGGTTDPDYLSWEDLKAGLLLGNIVMAVSHIYCEAHIAPTDYRLRLDVKLFKTIEMI